MTLRDPKEKRIEGELVTRISDAVSMQGAAALRFGRHGRTLPRSFPLATVQRLDISVGRSPFRGALLGATYGLIGATAYGGLVWVAGNLSSGGGYYRFENRASGWDQGRAAAIALMPIGALIGALNAPDKWRRVYPAR